MGRNRGGGGGRRGGGGGGGLFGGGKKPAPPQANRAPPPPQQRAPPPPAPAPQAHAPAAAPASGGGMMSGLGGMVAQGMALGAGSAVGHKMVDGVMGAFSGGSDAPAEQAQQAAPQQQAYPQSSGYSSLGNSGEVCSATQRDLYKCLEEQNQNAAACQFYFDALRQCQENSQYANQSY
mmetsp:Transcript_3064/g.4384  ORF Transcript_3064/g.4384 Transcript_3064/m.4384 type:complete len:178 (-) Transcript_3064:64-597(-)|eukprot:CAMPEP_0203776200 /NCGR_PEP_ID=MMETSP0099_2-20121227/6601_1 /ASSEMBLY_ACC=CAM_ASM_000209 /TAXON_ID=96639 /ORGANISM=" , Strain NY0313808BC1" /LENGTH=177 /DNA_ID=CAMNT_0050675155 /DNA_START=77 /DNA_END=610 /DNA_ORIENTATION=-